MEWHAVVCATGSLTSLPEALVPGIVESFTTCWATMPDK